jgi:hypothetical protein
VQQRPDRDAPRKSPRGVFNLLKNTEKNWCRERGSRFIPGADQVAVTYSKRSGDGFEFFPSGRCFRAFNWQHIVDGGQSVLFRMIASVIILAATIGGLAVAADSENSNLNAAGENDWQCFRY